jgi:hypothetical protein
MTLDQESAAASLIAIEQAERRTSRAIVYGIAGWFLILWGVISAVGYGFPQAYPAHAAVAWSVLTIAGFLATALMVARGHRGLTTTRSALGWQLVQAQLALMGFGVLVVTILGPFSGRQLSAFWPLVYMLGYVLAGIWIGRFFVLCGVAIAVLTVVGFCYTGNWFPLWMAMVNGGALIAGGVWLRRQGASL